MRKYQIIMAVIAVSSLLAAGGITAAISHNKQVHAQAALSDAEKAKRVQEWQENVRKWQEEEQRKAHTAATSSQSDLGNQGVAMLPETGPANIVATFFAVSAFATIAYCLAYRLRNTQLG